MPAQWAVAVAAVVAAVALAGCGRDDATEPVADTASTHVVPTTAPVPIQPALAAPTTAARATTTRPAPTTTSAPPPTTRPAPQPAPRPQPRPEPQPQPRPQAAAGGNDRVKESDDKPSGGSVYYKNCAAARAAGAAPVHKGEPGYARHLDRDGDGVGCE